MYKYLLVFLLAAPLCCNSTSLADKWSGNATIASEEYTPDENCAAIILHQEARGQGLRGMRAVMDVLVNRSKLRNLSICQVAKEKSQFSMAHKVRNWKATEEMLDKLAIIGFMNPAVPKSVSYFHSVNVKPSWASRRKFCCKIGDHLFYS